MNFLRTLVVRVLMGQRRPDGEPQRVYIIVRRPHAYLAGQLRKVFEGVKDVEILVDRRGAERRRRELPFGVEWRVAERRRLQEVECEVIIETRG